MTDRISAETRSRIMSRIRKKWSRLDRKTHGMLKGAKVRHKMYPNILGSPDVLVYPDILIFLDGCFWHCCPLCFRPPSSRINYWIPKLRGNQLRDIKISEQLRGQSWEIVRIWEHEITADPAVVLGRLRKLADRTNRKSFHRFAP